MMGRRPTPVPARFWPKVKIGEGDECWPWLGGRFKNGYGSFYLDGRAVGAHRVAYMLHHGGALPTRFTCHRCDNPRCCNPAHLFQGSASANTQDAVRKGRHRTPNGNHGNQRRGEQHGNAKLTDQQVREIRAKARAGGRGLVARLSREYDTPYATIYDIVRRRRR